MRKYKLGLIARADNSGLGMQTLEFYRHMKPNKTMVVDISMFNNNTQYPGRYAGPGVTFIHGFPENQDIESFLEGLDVVFIAESAYNRRFYNIAREKGVKTAVQYNYEFMDWMVDDKFPKPDMFIAPSMWHFADVNAWVNHCNQHYGTNIRHSYLHCPINTDVLHAKDIRKARTFLHIAGKAAAYDRNGTETVIKASRYLKTPAKIICHFQGEQGLPHQTTNTINDYQTMLNQYGDPERLVLRQQEFVDYQNVYDEGDVLLLPRRYGGNCLPVNEALGRGMPVIMTDIEPNNHVLPKQWLISANKIGSFTPRTEVDIYEASPAELAAKIDEFYLKNESQMWFENLLACQLASRISWQVLVPAYERVLGELCQS